jgi:hypothetical protein
LAAREWAKNNIHWIDAAYIARGAHDDAASIRAYLAGCTRGREGAKGLVEALEDAVAYIRGELGGTSQLYGLLKAADAALAFAKRGG